MNHSLIDDRVLNQFKALFENKRLAHAYLFVGPKHIGKYETALAVAQSLNASQGEDVSKRILDGSYPDVLTVQLQEGQSITIDQVRELISRSQLKPFEGQMKIFIVRDIEKLTLDASNALLKTLEEPSASSLIILTTSVLENILDTIRSRCHVVNFYTKGVSVVANDLMTQLNLPKQEALTLAGLSEGCFGRACQLHEDDFLKVKNDVIKKFVEARDVDEYLKKLTKDKGDVSIAIDVLYGFIRDVILAGQGMADQAIHQDQLKLIKSLAGRYTQDDLNLIYQQIVGLKKAHQSNFNVKIPFSLVKEMM